MPDITSNENKDILQDDTVVIHNIDELGLKNNNEVFVGGATNNIKFLYPEDEQLIDLDYIQRKVTEYISNYHSATYTNYKKTFNQLYQKYSKKNFIILNTNNKVTVYKTTNKNEKHIIPLGDKVFELSKPIYKHYNYDFFENMKRDLSNSRKILKQEYDILLSKIDLQQEDKNKFEQIKDKYIKKLQKYYIYTNYHHKINNINDGLTTHIFNPNLVEVLQDNQETKKVLLEYNLYHINQNIIDDINKINSDNLNKYNDIISTIDILPKSNVKKDPRWDELKKKIKDYLDKTNLNTYLKALNENIKKQDEYIYYIVETLPTVLFDG